MDHENNFDLPQFDSEDIRRDAAWYSTGVETFGAYAFVVGIATGSVTCLFAAIFDLDGPETGFAITTVIIATNAAVGQYLSFKARKIVKTESVRIDRY